MAKFTIRFEREVVQTDIVTRTIEADDLDAAQAKGEAMASEFDRSCPDDAAPEGGDDCQSWSPALVKLAADDAEIDD